MDIKEELKSGKAVPFNTDEDIEKVYAIAEKLNIPIDRIWNAKYFNWTGGSQRYFLFDEGRLGIYSHTNAYPKFSLEDLISRTMSITKTVQIPVML